MPSLPNINRVYALVIKELLTLFKDPRGRIVIIVPPIMQLLIFAFAATLEVKNITLAVYNEDYGKHSHEIIQRLIGSPTFTEIHFVSKKSDIIKRIDEQKDMAAISFGSNFSKNIQSGSQASMQLILDGRRSNSSQIITGYITSIVNQYNQTLQPQKQSPKIPIQIIERNWFNPNLLYIWFTVPSLICILSMLVSLVITALSVARERELGTFEQLLVSPLSAFEILLGKTIPALLIGIAEGGLIWFAAIWVFHIPFYGSKILMLIALIAFILSTVGVGLFISAISKTQQQAILGTFIYMVPAVTLSGYASPIENMPQWLQTVTWFNPLRHILVTVKGLFLKNLPWLDVLHNTIPLLIIGTATLSIASWYFKKRTE